MPAPMRKTSHLQVFSATSLMVMAPTFQSLLIMMSAYLTHVGHSHMVLKTTSHTRGCNTWPPKDGLALPCALAAFESHAPAPPCRSTVHAAIVDYPQAGWPWSPPTTAARAAAAYHALLPSTASIVHPANIDYPRAGWL